MQKALQKFYDQGFLMVLPENHARETVSRTLNLHLLATFYLRAQHRKVTLGDTNTVSGAALGDDSNWACRPQLPFGTGNGQLGIRASNGSALLSFRPAKEPDRLQVRLPDNCSGK